MSVFIYKYYAYSRFRIVLDKDSTVKASISGHIVAIILYIIFLYYGGLDETTAPLLLFVGLLYLMNFIFLNTFIDNLTKSQITQLPIPYIAMIWACIHLYIFIMHKLFF